MKTAQQIEEMAKELLKHLAPNSYIDHGLSEFTLKDAIKSILFIKKDLLESAIEGFDKAICSEWQKTLNEHDLLQVKGIWSLAQLVIAQEKDVEIEKLKEEIRNLTRADLIQTNREDVLPAAQEAAHYNWLDDQNEKLESQYQEVVKDIENLSKQLIDAFKNVEPEGCCSGNMCGCLGMPTNPEYYWKKLGEETLAKYGLDKKEG